MTGFSEQFPAEGLRRIELRIGRGDVQLERISGNMVEVQSSDSLQVDCSDGVMSVRPGVRIARDHLRAGSQKIFGPGAGDLGASISEFVSNAVDSLIKADLRLGMLGAADVRIGIPAIIERPQLVASTGSGEIEVTSLSGDCELQSNSGDITVSNCSGTLQVSTGMGTLALEAYDGPITAKTGSGDARLSDCGSGGAVHTGSGDIEGRNLAGNWTLHSGAGDVGVRVKGDASFEIATGAGDVEVTDGALASLSIQSGSGDVTCTSLLSGPRHQLSTGHGDITVAIAESPGARLQILTRNGDVRSDYPLVAVGKQGRYSQGNGRFVGNIGDSAIDVELRTSSGDISIVRRDPKPGFDMRSPESQAYRARPAGAHADARDSDRWPESQTRNSQLTQNWERDSEALSPTVRAEPRSAEQMTDPSSDTGEVDSPNRGATSPVRALSENPRLAILTSLQEGKITVGEASALLNALSKQ